MKKQWIIVLVMLAALVLTGCGKEDAGEKEASSAEAPAVTASLSEETDDGQTRYENMYFSLELPSEEDLQITEERSSEYYLVKVREKSGSDLMEIELSARSRELTEDQFYFGELYIPGDQGHLNILVTCGSGASEERIRGILDTMEPCGEFSINRK